MPVSHLTNSVAEILAFGLNEATGGSYSHLTTSEDQMLALLVSEMTGQEYSHLTTGRETLWELLLTQAASDGISFDRNTQSNEQIAAIIANNVSAGGGEEYEGPIDIVAGAVVADGQRALSAAMLGEPYATLRRASDDAELEFDFDAEDGSVPSGSITTWAGGDAFVKVLQDQSGGAHHASEADTTRQPQWLASQAGTVPAIYRDVGRLVTSQSIEFAAGDPLTMFLVFKLEDFDNDSCEMQFLGAASKSASLVMFPGFSEVIVNTGAASNDFYFEKPTEVGTYIFEVTIDASGNVAVWINGEAQTLPEDTALPIPAMTAALSSNVRCRLFERLAWKSVVSAPDRLAVRQNIADFYGITLP